MRDIVLTAMILGALPVAAMRPAFGLLLYAWVSYMNPHRLTWGFAFDMPFAAMAAAATFIGIVTAQDLRRPPWTRTTLLLLLLAIWYNVTTLTALVPEWAWEEWDRTMKILLMTALTLMLIQGKQRMIALIWVIVVSIGFFGVKGGLFALLTGGNYMVWGPAGSFYEGNNSLAAALLMVMPLMWFLQGNTTHRWVRNGLRIAIVLCMFSVLASYSRGAFLGLAAVGMYMMLRSNKRLLAIPLIVFGGLVGLAFMPDQYIERLQTIQNYEEDGSAMGRINAWWFAYHLANDHPVTGGGFQTFAPHLFERYAPEPEDFHDAHSIYFEVLGEHGWVGFTLYMLLLASVFFEAGRIRRRCAGRPELKWVHDLCSMLQVSFVGYGVTGAFLGLAYFNLYYLLITLVILAHQHYRLVNAGVEPEDRPVMAAGAVKPQPTPVQPAPAP